MSTLRVAFLGVAHMHAATYASLLPSVGGEVVGAYDPDGGLVEDFARRFGCRAIPPGTADAAVSRELARLRPDAIVVAGTNARHRELLEAGAALGVPVLLEKPLGASLDDAARIRSLVRERSLPVFMALPMRFNSVVRSVRANLAAGRLGSPAEPFGVRAVHATNHGKVPSGWFVRRNEAGGGALLDHTIHLVDAVHWLLGAEPVDVHARAAGSAGEVERFALLTMRWTDGVTAVLDPSWAHPAKYPIWPDFTLRIVGEAGVVEADAFRQALAFCGDEEGPRSELWADDEDAAMVRAFAAFVRFGGRGADAPTVDDAFRAQCVAEAAYRSVLLGRVVRVEEVGEWR